jgi:hypothetical protein
MNQFTRVDATSPEEAVRRQIAHATLRLRRYRLTRDRARALRLKSQPHLARLITALLEAKG